MGKFLVFQEILSFFLPYSASYTNAKFIELECTGIELGHRDFETHSPGVFDVRAALNIVALAFISF